MVKWWLPWKEMFSSQIYGSKGMKCYFHDNQILSFYFYIPQKLGQIIPPNCLRVGW